jgi:hypothetical protein
MVIVLWWMRRSIAYSLTLSIAIEPLIRLPVVTHQVPLVHARTETVAVPFRLTSRTGMYYYEVCTPV